MFHSCLFVHIRVAPQAKKLRVRPWQRKRSADQRLAPLSVIYRTIVAFPRRRKNIYESLHGHSCSAAGEKNSVSVRGKEKGAPTSGAPYHACFFPVDVVRRDYLRTTLMFFTVPSLSVICFTKTPLLLASTMRPCRS